MTTITTRAGKGAALTYEEADANFTNLKTDVESLQGNITAANAAIVTANTAMKSYVDAVTTAWTANAGAQANQIAGANAAIITANTAVKNYVDTQITTTQSWVTGANAAIVSANTALKGYTDAQISTANTALKSYVDTQDSAITSAWTANAGAQANQIAGANAAIVTANSAVVSLVNTLNSAMAANVAGANAAVITANTALKGYVDAQFTALTNGAPAILDTLGEIATSLGNNASLSTTLLNSIAGSNAAIITANTAMKSYVDAQITTTQGQITTANTALKGYVDAANTTMTSYVGNQVTAANTAMKSYVDAQITTTQGQITTANTALKSYTDAQITTTQGQITTANTALKAYVDAQDTSITSAWTSNAGAQADQIAGANAAIITANTALKSYVDTQISTTQGQIVTANTAVKNYADTQIATANTALKSYTDGQISTTQGQIVTANTAMKSYVDAVTTAWTANAASQQAQIDSKVNSASLATVATTGSYTDLTNTPAAYGNTQVGQYLAGTVTVGNITSTNGYFWANGTAYSTGAGGGGGSFSGDLAGNTLTATTTGRIIANAYPQQNITQIGSYTQAVVVNTPPSYTGANLNSQNQTVSMVINGNVSLLTTYANATNRTTNGTTAYLGVTATSSNISMNPSDRVRGLATGLDLNLNGKNWGLLTSASNTLTPIATNGQTQNLYGTGQVGQTVAIGSAINITPVNGSISAQYVTSNFPSITYATTGGGYTASNINTARLYSGAMTATANLTITNAIALHTFSGWVSSNVSLVTNAYTVLNEDSRSIIQTNGNLTVTGALSTVGNLRVTGYNSPAKRYANPSSGNVAVNSSSMQSFQQIALAGNVGITASSNGFDTIYDFKVEQDGTGGRTLTWYDNSGSSNTQVYGFLNPIPNSATIARAIMSDGGLWTVNYANPTAPVNTAATWRLYPGTAGATVCISDAGGKLAYWDTTNSRWSYIFDNSAV